MTTELAPSLAKGRMQRLKDALSSWDPTLGLEIVQLFAKGMYFKDIAKMPGMPSATMIGLWITYDLDGIAGAIKRVSGLRSHELRRQMVAIADRRQRLRGTGKKDSMVEVVRDKLRNDVRLQEADKLDGNQRIRDEGQSVVPVVRIEIHENYGATRKAFIKSVTNENIKAQILEAAPNDGQDDQLPHDAGDGGPPAL